MKVKSVKYIRCSDCKVEWMTYCALCKDQAWEERRKKSVKKKSKIRTRSVIDEQPFPITIENFFMKTTGTFEELESIPKDFYGFFSTKGSNYYTNKEQDTLIRESDHWGWKIAQCTWLLRGYEKIGCWKWAKQYGKEMKIGIIKFTDFKENK